MSNDKNWLLALIIAAIEKLNHPGGSRISELMAAIKIDNPDQDAETFDKKCEMFQQAFLYGVSLELLVPSRNLLRYKVTKTGSKVARFLATTKVDSSGDRSGCKGLEECEPTERRNRDLVDLRSFQSSQDNKSDSSDNEII